MVERNYAAIGAVNIVENVIAWDKELYPDYKPAPGLTLIQSDTAAIGYTYDPTAQTFSAPNPPADDTPPGPAT